MYHLRTGIALALDNYNSIEAFFRHMSTIPRAYIGPET